MPGVKSVYRLFGKDGFAILDLLQLPEEDPPRICEKVLCRHPFEESKRAFVTPHKVQILHELVWKDGRNIFGFPPLFDIRSRVDENLKLLVRSLRYKVVSIAHSTFKVFKRFYGIHSRTVYCRVLN